jgi:hypothetical protein
MYELYLNLQRHALVQRVARHLNVIIHLRHDYRENYLALNHRVNRIADVGIDEIHGKVLRHPKARIGIYQERVRYREGIREREEGAQSDVLDVLEIVEGADLPVAHVDANRWHWKVGALQEVRRDRLRKVKRERNGQLLVKAREKQVKAERGDVDEP